MTTKPATNEELAAEAKSWDEGKLTPKEWEDAPDAIPRIGESADLNLRLPRQLVAIIDEFAARCGVSAQALIKQWLDERIRQEQEQIQKQIGPTASLRS